MQILFKLFVCSFFVLTFETRADTNAKTIIDLVRETPANLTGLVSLDKTTEVYKTKKFLLDIGVKVNANEQIGFEASEHHLKLMPDKAITVEVQGMSVPVSVSSLYYDDAINSFSVKIKTPLPRGIEDKIARSIEETLNETYRSKVVQAFKELKKVRASQDKNDVQKVVQSISAIFSSSQSKIALPTVRGELSINLQPVKKQKFSFGDWKVEVEGNDNLAVGVKFEKGPNKLAVHALELSSKTGLTVYGNTSVPEVNSLVAFNLKLDENGSEFRYAIGAEEVIAGYQQVLGFFSALAGRPTGTPGSCNCKSIELTPIRQQIDKKFKEQISKFVKANKQTLLEKGATPELLSALE